MDIKVITFDLDGVYFPDGKAHFISALGKLGVDEAEARRVFLQSPQMNEQYKTGKWTDEQFWTWAVGEWKLGIPWQRIVKTLIDSYRVDREVELTVMNLKNAGYKLAICSNNFPARINGLQLKFGFLDHFQIVILSYQVGVCKPSTDIFSRLISLSYAEPSQIVFADDNSANLTGASGLGITTLVYENFPEYLRQLRSLGVRI